MVSEETLALARHYLEKHAVPEERFGLGPFLESGNYRLFASQRAMINGAMNLEIFGDFWDCRTIAEAMHLDILANNPELEPRIMSYKNTVQHSWVEIKDPQTGETTQIDGTPWYAKLNPGNEGKEAPSGRMLRVLRIEKSSGIPVSVKQIGNDDITVYLYGFLPRVSIEEMRKEELRRMVEDNGIIKKIREFTEPPEYRFVLSGVLDSGFYSGEPKDFSHVFINVLDSMKLQEIICSAKSIDDLVAAGVLQIGFIFVVGKDSEIIIPCSSLDFMRKFAERKGHDNIFAEIERNIPKLMLLLRQARLILEIYGDDTKYVDVKHGNMGMNFNPIQFRFNEDKPLDPWMEDKYRRLLEMTAGLKNFQRTIQTPDSVTNSTKLKRIKIR